MIQRVATKFILSNYPTDYKSHLQTLRLLPLMMIFAVNDIILKSITSDSVTDSFNIRDYVALTESPTTATRSNLKILVYRKQRVGVIFISGNFLVYGMLSLQ